MGNSLGAFGVAFCSGRGLWNAFPQRNLLGGLLSGTAFWGPRSGLLFGHGLIKGLGRLNGGRGDPQQTQNQVFLSNSLVERGLLSVFFAQEKLQGIKATHFANFTVTDFKTQLWEYEATCPGPSCSFADRRWTTRSSASSCLVLIWSAAWSPASLIFATVPQWTVSLCWGWGFAWRRGMGENFGRRNVWSHRKKMEKKKITNDIFRQKNNTKCHEF